MKKIQMYWLFEAVNGRLKELGKCFFASGCMDAVDGGKNMGLHGNLVAISDRVLYPEEYKKLKTS